MPNIVSLTRNAAADALRTYFEPISWLKGAKKHRELSASKIATNAVTPDVTYSEIESARKIRELERALPSIVKIDVSFVKEDFLYADMLKGVLGSRKVIANLNKAWVKQSKASASDDVEVVVWSSNYSSRYARGTRPEHHKLENVFVVRVDDSSVDVSEFASANQLDASMLTVRAAAESLLSHIVESKRERVNLAVKKT